MTSADFASILPEFILACYAMGALIFAVYTGKDETAPLLSWLSAAVMLVMALWIMMRAPLAHAGFGGMFVEDGFARFAKVTILGAGGLVLLMSEGWLRARRMLKFEYPVLLVLASVGMMVMVSAGDLMVLYMGLELQSLSLYVIAAFNRDSLRSTEAGLKYFVLGALASGLLLYGASLIYGFAGTTSLAGILQAVGGASAAGADAGALPLGLLFGLVFMLTGLAFKVSAVPFHMWTPDVYEGAPTPVTAFFATAPKMAAMGLIARLLVDGFGGAAGAWGQILALLAAASMLIGAIAAIGQTNIKRLMAYSSIAHMGFALMGLAAGSALGVQAMLVYMAIYVMMNLGSFAFILSMQRDGRPVEQIDSLAMLSRHDPLRALAMGVLLFSLAGVPPFLGFFAKFAVLQAALDAGLTWLAVIGVIASVIGAYYYLRIVYVMYFAEPRDEAINGGMQPAQWAVLMGAAAVMVLGLVNLFGIDGAAAAAAGVLFN